MLVNKFRCPNCDAALKAGAGVRAGQVIRCPKCDHRFRISKPGEGAQQSEEEDPEPDRNDHEDKDPSLRKKRQKTESASSKPVLRSRYDEPEPATDDGEDEEAPRVRGKRRKARKSKPAASPLLIGLVGGLILVLVIGGGFGLYFLLRKDRLPETPPVASQPPDQNPADRSPPAKRPSGGEDAKAGWKEISSAEGRFKALMPIGTVERTRTVPSLVGRITDRAYLYELEGEARSYAITYADFSEAQLKRASLEQVIDSGRDEIVKTYRGELEGDRNIDLNGHRGREVVVRVPGKGYLLTRYYIVGPRLYTVGAAGAKAVPDSEDVRTFFKSFQLTGQKP